MESWLSGLTEGAGEVVMAPRSELLLRSQRELLGEARVC